MLYKQRTGLLMGFQKFNKQNLDARHIHKNNQAIMNMSHVVNQRNKIGFGPNKASGHKGGIRKTH